MFMHSFVHSQISADDGIRATTTMEILGKLRPAFAEGGTTTAGTRIYETKKMDS